MEKPKRSKRGENYLLLLLSQGATREVDDKFSVEQMTLPSYADFEKLEKGRKFFAANFFSAFFSMYTGLISILAVPSILKVLIFTKKSTSVMGAYKRYMRTIYHTLTWVRYPFTSNSQSWKSLQQVRKGHFIVSKGSNKAGSGIISQKDMAITQFGFIGYILLNQEMLGIQATQEDIEAFAHLFRVVGHILGIQEQFNVCTDSFEETCERLQIIKEEFIVPGLQFPSTDFNEMTKYIVDGMWCFEPLGIYEVIMFFNNRLAGVPNYHYFEDEVPEGSTMKDSKLYELSLYNRYSLYIKICIHNFWLKYNILRIWLNLEVWFHEFLIRYFPFLAIYKFGFKNAYVKI